VPISSRAPSLIESCVVVALGTGCTVDNGDGMTSFGSSAPTSFTTAMTATVDPSSGATTDDVSTSATSDEPSTTAGEDEESGDSSASGSTAAGTSGGVDEQPDSGMYSDCAVITDCVGQNICVVVADDGYCSTTPCTDPTMDCDASPGGTATPICAQIMVGMAMSTACALDCSAGKTCPGGMTCSMLGGGMACT
jgi:hypothetical protein